MILFNATYGSTDEIDGTLESSTFTAEDLEGPLQGQTMTNLVDAIEDGQAYVNVHTEANSPGEIRGTIEQAPATVSDNAQGDYETLEWNNNCFYRGITDSQKGECNEEIADRCAEFAEGKTAYDQGFYDIMSGFYGTK